MARKTPTNLFSKLNKNAMLRSFLLFRLPLAYLAGTRMVSFDRDKATVGMKYKWINRNPFRSMYFAAMNMGAELACGLLLFAHIQEFDPKVSMMLEGQSGEYKKKALGKVLFICQQGDEIRNAVNITRESSEAHKFDVKVYATDEVGNILATFIFKWSLKKMDEEQAVD